MKERKRGGVILVCERHFSKSVCRGSGELGVAIIIHHLLQICAGAGNAIQISIAFAQREIGVCPARTPWKIIEILLIFRSSQIVEFASEQTVCVLKLTLIGPLAFARPRP